jgi:hypothetical protein
MSTGMLVNLHSITHIRDAILSKLKLELICWYLATGKNFAAFHIGLYISYFRITLEAYKCCHGQIVLLHVV